MHFFDVLFLTHHHFFDVLSVFILLIDIFLLINYTNITFIYHFFDIFML